MKNKTIKSGKFSRYLRQTKSGQTLCCILTFVMITVLSMFLLTACGNEEVIVPEPDIPEVVVDDPEPEPEPEPDPEPEEEVQEPEEEEELEEPDTDEPEEIGDTGFVNPLTGMPTETDISRNRPLAVSVNNVRPAMPKHGLTQADMIFETLVEGGLTRNLAIFKDISNVSVIGSIRSARPYWVSIVRGMDAMFLHEGGSPQALALLSEWGINRIYNGQTGVNSIYRDQGRRSSLGSEHSLMVSGERLAKELPNLSYRLELKDDYKYPLVFVPDGTPANGTPVDKITATFSSAKSTTFVYNEETGRFGVEQYGRADIDGNNNTQLKVTNLIIIKTQIGVIPGDDAGRQQIETVGSGSGYFANGGQYIEIKWNRASHDVPFSYTLADGTTPLELGRGNTYVCIVPMAQDVRFE